MAVDGRERSGTGPQRLRHALRAGSLSAAPLRGREERIWNIPRSWQCRGRLMIAVRASPLAASFAR
jgi:hypothetical protein